MLSGYSPTDIEQYYLELLDDARFNPAAYGDSLGIDLSGVAPAQPLAMNTLLVESARLHSQDMIAQDYFSHITPQGADPGDRIAATGFAATGWAESIETNTKPVAVGGGFPAELRGLGCRLQPLRPDRRPGRARTSATASCCSTSAASTSDAAGGHRHRVAGFDGQSPSSIGRPTPRSTWPRPPTPSRS